LALKRYELRHGQMPPDLGALVPAFLVEAPRDMFDGKPLRYRLRDGGGFLLYSIGKDANDDGGDAKPPSEKNFNWTQGRDLVWPQPASAEEIEAVDKKASGTATPKPSKTN
jgi:hypothetical protein